jgi:hypothetical protein
MISKILTSIICIFLISATNVYGENINNPFEQNLNDTFVIYHSDIEVLVDNLRQTHADLSRNNCRAIMEDFSDIKSLLLKGKLNSTNIQLITHKDIYLLPYEIKIKLQNEDKFSGIFDIKKLLFPYKGSIMFDDNRVEELGFIIENY